MLQCEMMVCFPGEQILARDEIDDIRALLGSKPRPVGWAERRQRLDEVGSTWPVAADVKCDAVDCDGVPGEWSLVPGSDPAHMLLYFHGGGYCSGSIASHRRLVTEAGRAARVRTLAIDYRRAPEHPYPAAHEDALTTWRFLRKQGIAAENIAVGGDSAGGNLTLGLIQRLRAAGEALPACAWLVSPWTDLTMSGATLATKDARRSTDPQSLSDRTRGRLCAQIDRPQRSPDLAAVRRTLRFSAHADSGRIGGDAAGGRHAPRCRSRIRRHRCDVGNLAAHDPRVAALECEAPGRTPCAGKGRAIYPRSYAAVTVERVALAPKPPKAVFGQKP